MLLQALLEKMPTVPLLGRVMKSLFDVAVDRVSVTWHGADEAG